MMSSKSCHPPVDQLEDSVKFEIARPQKSGEWPTSKIWQLACSDIWQVAYTRSLADGLPPKCGSQPTHIYVAGSAPKILASGPLSIFGR